MIIDISFAWHQNTGIDESDAVQNSQAQDIGDYDITQPVAILTLADTDSPAAKKGPAVDPYDNEYWIKLPL